MSKKRAEYERKRDRKKTPGPFGGLLLRKRDVYEPMLATLVEELPRGAGWLFEPKWNGYRVLGYVRGRERPSRRRCAGTR